MSNGESARSWLRARCAVIGSFFLLVALCFALYGRTAGYGFSYYDDDALVLAPGAAASRAERPLSALGQPYFPKSERDHAYYRPLVSFSFALDAKGSGRDAGGYHTTNVALHALSACLVLLLGLSYGYAPLVALLGALVFAVHPVLACTVAWIPGRDDALLAVFSLAAWLFYRHARASERRTPAVAHFVAWFLALLCKEAALALPLVLVLEALILDRRSLKQALPGWLVFGWAAALVAYLGLRASVLGPGLGLGAAFAGQLGGGLRAVVSGLGQLLWPHPETLLAVPEDMPFGRGLIAAGLFAAVLGWSRARRQLLVFALLAYLALSLPSLPATRLLSLDSRLYLPAVPLVLALCELLARERAAETTRLGVAAFVVILLALGTERRLVEFRDRLSFARAAVLASPHSSLAHRNLGVAQHEAGAFELARREYERALAADPDEPLVHNNLAVLLMAEGHLGEAERELELELSLHPGSPEAERNLALVESRLRPGVSP